MSKDLINTGVVGDSSTGDSLFTGGGKINAMFEEIYDAFGLNGANPQNIHATGYFQTPARTYFTFPVQPGAQLNVDTRNGDLTVKLPNGKIGEMVRLRDIHGSWFNSPVTVQPDGLETINGVIGGLVLNVALTEVVFVCINDTPGSVNWTYSISSISSRDIIKSATGIIDRDFVLAPSTPISHLVCPVNAITTVKLLVSGLQSSGGVSATSSEIHLVTDGVTHAFSEFSVLNTGTDRVYDIDFSVVSGNLMMAITTTLTGARVHVQATDYTKILIS
jgi:hypothetical protein